MGTRQVLLISWGDKSLEYVSQKDREKVVCLFTMK